MRSIQRQNKPKSKSCIITVSWVAIVAWTLFLIYVAVFSPWKPAETLQSPSTTTNIRKPMTEPAEPLSIESPNLGFIPPNDPDQLHVVFSTDCETFQDWQTLLIFHSAEVVNQPGALTRIASGCTEEKKVFLTSLYKKLHPNYHVHFTPDFKRDAKTNQSYDFYNKPFGVKHWLQHANPPVQKGDVIAVVDPDFIFLRPLTKRMAGKINNIVSGPVKTEHIFELAGEGKAVGQHYGLGAPWTNDNHKKFNRTFICGANSPCLNVPSEYEGGRFYSVGPPYILERDDWIHLTTTWTEFVPRVYEHYPFLLAEMYAYSMAAAHENLPHLRMDHFMVSNTDSSGEGWPWVDALGDDVCVDPINGVYYPNKPLPTFVHYCQSFHSANFSFWKRAVARDIFKCESPMLFEPPSDLGKTRYINHGSEKKSQSEEQNRRNAFMICTIHKSFNAALKNYKDKMCSPTANVNYQKAAMYRG